MRTDAPSGVTEVRGFEAGAAWADVRENGREQLDVGIIYSQQPCAVAGVFTRNDIQAAPVRLCRERLAAGGPVRAIVVNSGNANACTGPQGERDARNMAAVAAEALGCAVSEVLVASTGRIGRNLPMTKLAHGIEAAASARGNGAVQGKAFAESILTSDTRPKTARASAEGPWGRIMISGTAKGAGMIHPNMATMLAFLVSDAPADRAVLDTVLREAVDRTFNRISVDGDCSTNDTVLLVANGAAGTQGQAWVAPFAEAVERVCRQLAYQIVGDGERITKVVHVKVTGGSSAKAAEAVARAIGNSLLVKTSWYGEDPNWGRLVHAAGYACVGIEEARLSLAYDAVPVLVRGELQSGQIEAWREVVRQREFSVNLDLGQGGDEFDLLCNDLSEGYVAFNRHE